MVIISNVATSKIITFEEVTLSIGKGYIISGRTVVILFQTLIFITGYRGISSQNPHPLVHGASPEKGMVFTSFGMFWHALEMRL